MIHWWWVGGRWTSKFVLEHFRYPQTPIGGGIVGGGVTMVLYRRSGSVSSGDGGQQHCCRGANAITRCYTDKSRRANRPASSVTM
ncbi:hypothetical protein V1478_006373 [Vespula squamosa]|uniref:Uncharacterized protein n=1 Tax=Vespula squamosa TaxID=30214 RepID=A0ABD2B7N2_VESSQ